MMNRNYRSTPQVIAAANSLIAKNRTRVKKDLVPTRPSGESVLCHHAKNSRAEAEWIAGEIAKLREKGVDLKDIALLYRAHYVTRPIEEVFIEKKLPYAIYSGVQFFARAEIKDALSYLRMVAYRDDLSFRRVVNKPKRNIGVSRMKLIEERSKERGVSLYSALIELAEEDRFRGTKAKQFISLIESYSSGNEGRPVSELLASILDESGYEQALRTEGSQERLDNLAELRQAVYEYETTCGEEATLESYLSHIALFTNADTAESGGKVKLMTVHAAKGLEFPYVFLCGMNEGVFPSRKVSTLPGMEEERRLAFVAMTRAKDRLFLSEAEGLNHDGSFRYPSRFILDIDECLIERTAPVKEGLIKDAREYAASRERFLTEGDPASVLEVGSRVSHPVLGEGEIIEVDTERGAHIVKFNGLDTPRAISFRAKLALIE